MLSLSSIPAAVSSVLASAAGQAESSAPQAESGGSPSGLPLPDASMPAARELWETLRTNLDLLNHPQHVESIVSQISIVWAIIFLITGTMCVTNGYRWHKPFVLLLAAAVGLWAGTTFGGSMGGAGVIAACAGVVSVILAWPLLRYAVAVFGGLAGAFAGANVWTAIGQPEEQHFVGAVVGFIIVGMLAFTAFRGVVVILTTVAGATLLVAGGLAAMMQVDSWQNGIRQALDSHTHIIPIVVGSIAVTGAVLQIGGGVKGLNAMANKADTSKAKPATG